MLEKIPSGTSNIWRLCTLALMGWPLMSCALERVPVKDLCNILFRGNFILIIQNLMKPHDKNIHRCIKIIRWLICDNIKDIYYLHNVFKQNSEINVGLCGVLYFKHPSRAILAKKYMYCDLLVNLRMRTTKCQSWPPGCSLAGFYTKVGKLHCHHPLLKCLLTNNVGTCRS